MLRAGFGLFFDRYPLAFLNDAIQKDNRQGFEQYAIGDSAAQVFSLTRGARLPGPFGALQRSAYVVDPDFPTTYSWKFAVSVERSFGDDTTLAAEVTRCVAFTCRGCVTEPAPSSHLPVGANGTFDFSWGQYHSQPANAP